MWDFCVIIEFGFWRHLPPQESYMEAGTRAGTAAGMELEDGAYVN